MGEKTAIEWADHTWSPWIGCTKLNPACDGCYAEHLMDTRLGHVEWGPHGERRRTSADYWRQPLRWNRAAAAAGIVESVFPSLCDPFDNQADPEVRREWFGLIRETPNLLWLILTKRPQNIVKMVKAIGFMPSNIAFGVTCEDRERVKINLPHLMVAAGLRPRFLFMSGEPLLASLGDLSPWLRGDPCTQDGNFTREGIKIDAEGWPILPALGLVITGGETDQGAHKARPTHHDLYREVRDQCAAFGTPYLHKQNGEWADADTFPSEVVESFDAQGLAADGVIRVGKKRAGRLLDGVTHDGFPNLTGARDATA